jgi:hypothetical protein
VHAHMFIYMVVFLRSLIPISTYPHDVFALKLPLLFGLTDLVILMVFLFFFVLFN